MLQIQTLTFSLVPKVRNKLLTSEEVNFKQFQFLHHFLLFFKLPSYESNILENCILRFLNVLFLDSFDSVIVLILIFSIILKFIMKVAGRRGEAFDLCSEVSGSNITRL